MSVSRYDTPPQVSDSGSETLRTVESQLAGHPSFGNSERILGRADARYRFALEVLGSQLPGAAADADTITKSAEYALRDPVLITACEDAMLRLERGDLHALDEFETVTGLVADRLREFPGLLPTQAEDEPVFLLDRPSRIWLLGMRPKPGPLLQRLHDAMTDQFLRYNQVTGNFCPADAAAAESISRAIELLRLLLPQLSASVIEHISAVALLSGTTPTGRHLSAAGGDLVPGTIVLSPHLLSSPWDCSGILLHEGLHLKAFDIMRSFALVSEPRETIEIPWRHVRWDMRRVFVSFHVYAHLVLFQAAALHRADELSAQFGPLPDNVAVSRSGSGEYAGSVDRMRFLGEQLVGPLRGNLTQDGLRLVNWLLQVTSPLTGWQETRQPAAQDAPVRQDVPVPQAAPGVGDTRYRRVPGIVVKPLPDLEMAYVYNPGTRQVSCLNLHAWAILELCDPDTNLADSYANLVGHRLGPENTSRHLAAGVAQLAEQALITRV